MTSPTDRDPRASGAAPAQIFENFDRAEEGHAEEAGRPIDAMLNVDLHVQVVVGRSRMPISQLLKISRGSVIELDRRIGDPVDIVVSNVTIARGDLVKLEDGKLGVTIKEIVKEYVTKES